MHDRVTLMGWQDEPSLKRILAAATVMVAPSIVAGDGDQDGIPNVLLEACALGVPVVASDLPGISQLIVDRISGLLTPPGDTNALADVLEEMCDHPDLRRQQAIGGRRMVETYFDVHANTRRLVHVFEEVCFARKTR